MKVRRILSKIIIIITAAVFSVLFLPRIAFFVMWNIGEYIGRQHEMREFADDLKNDTVLRNSLTELNEYLLNKGNVNYEIYLSYCELENISSENKIGKLLYEISEIKSPDTNYIFKIAVRNDNIYYVFEEYDFILVYSERNDFDIKTVDDKRKFKRFDLGDSFYLFAEKYEIS